MARPVRPGTGTTRALSKASQLDKQNGTRFADPIRASSPIAAARTGRTEDCTRPTRQTRKSPLQCGSHPQRTKRTQPWPTEVGGTRMLPERTKSYRVVQGDA